VATPTSSSKDPKSTAGLAVAGAVRTTVADADATGAAGVVNLVAPSLRAPWEEDSHGKR
jgi:hypothetical protein